MTYNPSITDEEAEAIAQNLSIEEQNSKYLSELFVSKPKKKTNKVRKFKNYKNEWNNHHKEKRKKKKVRKERTPDFDY